MTLATPQDAVREYAWNAGQDCPDTAWLLHPFDVWVENPHYTGPAVPHPESEDMSPPDGLIDCPKAAHAFIVGGNATFTLVSCRTRDRYTFRVRVAKDNPTMFFVSTLVGSDNESDYEYLGFFRTYSDLRFLSDHRTGSVLLAGRKGNPNDKRFKAFDWLMRALGDDCMPRTVEFWHENKCARCGRKLTDPESIASGFGPECRKHV